MRVSQQFLKENPEALGWFEKVRIWSDEWRMWWRPNARGYTPNQSEAGVYDTIEAWAHVAHCGPEKKISLVAA